MIQMTQPAFQAQYNYESVMISLLILFLFQNSQCLSIAF